MNENDGNPAPELLEYASPTLPTLRVVLIVVALLLALLPFALLAEILISLQFRAVDELVVFLDLLAGTFGTVGALALGVCLIRSDPPWVTRRPWGERVAGWVVVLLAMVWVGILVKFWDLLLWLLVFGNWSGPG